MSMIPETRYAKGPNGRIAYQVIGEGPLDLIFRPDPLVNLEIMWEEPNLARFLRNLASFSRLICFDSLGYGVSDPLPSSHRQTATEFAEDFEVVMQAAGSERAAIFAHGAAGRPALCQAVRAPEHTLALILGDTFPCLSRQPDYPCGLPKEAFEKLQERLERDWGTGELAGILVPSLAGDASFRHIFARLQRTGVRHASVQDMFRAANAEDLRSLLPEIRMPTLVLHHAGDRWVRVDHGRYMGSHIPGAKYVELPGEDHYFFFTDKADAVVHEVQSFLTGTTTATDAERVLVTVLFLDIVESTKRAAEIGDHRWRDLLDAFYRVVRQELSRHRGQECDTAGDGFLASFDAPTRAIRCATALSQELAGLGIPIRAGLHTGECERVGIGVRGLAVHIGARVAAQAQPGEVLVSSTVREAVAGSALKFADRGTHTLKGVPGEWRLFALED